MVVLCYCLGIGTLVPVWGGLLWGRGNPERNKTAFRSRVMFFFNLVGIKGLWERK